MLGDHHKSASFISTHTPGTEDPNMLPGPGSVAGHTEPLQEELEGELFPASPVWKTEMTATSQG